MVIISIGCVTAFGTDIYKAEVIINRYLAYLSGKDFVLINWIVAQPAVINFQISSLVLISEIQMTACEFLLGYLEKCFFGRRRQRLLIEFRCTGKSFCPFNLAGTRQLLPQLVPEYLFVKTEHVAFLAGTRPRFFHGVAAAETSSKAG